jgi:hypothetical protein
MDNLFVGERVAIGKDWEKRITTCLKNHYGIDLLDSTTHEDRIEKTDRWFLGQNGKKYRCAIKVRLDKNKNIEENKKDMLIALRDPFYGINSERTVIGRDVKVPYSMFISLADGQIRIAYGKRIKEITNLMWEEYLEKNGDFVPSERGFRPILLLNSKKQEGCQIWLHFDRDTRKPKLLAFIPPQILEPTNHIKYLKFIEE